ncbi:unnamed protein product [Timema podura]|uniref:Uncharacterized protein n=1 Tax=Timema podura TaxID=61482 RepID=A0ABN7P0X2_TIMPD|nr:unnamed protein product [Timema podura]
MCVEERAKTTSVVVEEKAKSERDRKKIEGMRKGVGYGKEQVKQDENGVKDQLVTAKKTCQGVERGSCDSTANLGEGDERLTRMSAIVNQLKKDKESSVSEVQKLQADMTASILKIKRKGVGYGVVGVRSGIWSRSVGTTTERGQS